MSAPLSFARINDCQTLEDLNRFLTAYSREKQISAGQVDQIESKVASLYQKAVAGRPNSLVYVEALSIVYIVKKACAQTAPNVFERLFGKHERLKEIENDCVRNIRADKSLMDRITANYDATAERINQAMKNRDWQEIKGVYQADFEQLEFLNQILGLRWSRSQKAGERPVPRWLGDLMTVVGIADKRPNECETMEELLGLIVATDENKEDVFRHMTASEKEKMIDAMAKQIEKLYKDALKQPAYSHATTFWQTYASIFHLGQISRLTGSSRMTDKKLQAILDRCLTEIRQDKRRMGFLISTWNKLAGDWNNITFQHYHVNRPDPHQRPYPTIYWAGKYRREKMLVEFFAPILDFRITDMQLNKRALLPMFPLRHVISFPHHEVYNRYAMIVNHEIPLRQRWSTLEHLKYQLTHPFVSTTLSDSDRAVLNENIKKLEAQLACEADPLPPEMFQTLLDGILWMSDFIGIPLTNEQLQGKSPLPVIGRDEFKKPLAKPAVRKVQLPYEWALFNTNVQMINEFIEWREKKQQYIYLQSILASRMDHASYEIAEQIHKLREALDPLEKKMFLKDSERWFIEKLSMLLTINSICQFVQLDADQKAGLKPWPEAPIEAIGDPPKEAELLQELQGISKDQMDLWTLFWPPNWTENR